MPKSANLKKLAKQAKAQEQEVKEEQKAATKKGAMKHSKAAEKLAETKKKLAAAKKNGGHKEPEKKEEPKAEKHEKAQPVVHRSGESLFKSDDERARAKAVGLDGTFKKNEDGTLECNIKLGDYDLDLDMANEGTARGMIRDWLKYIEAAVEERVEERMKEEAKKAKAASK